MSCGNAVVEVCWRQLIPNRAGQLGDGVLLKQLVVVFAEGVAKTCS